MCLWTFSVEDFNENEVNSTSEFSYYFFLHNSNSIFTYRHTVMMIRLTWFKSVLRSVLVFAEQLAKTIAPRLNSKVKRETKTMSQAF